MFAYVMWLLYLEWTSYWFNTAHSVLMQIYTRQIMVCIYMQYMLKVHHTLLHSVFIFENKWLVRKTSHFTCSSTLQTVIFLVVMLLSPSLKKQYDYLIQSPNQCQPIQFYHSRDLPDFNPQGKQSTKMVLQY